MEMPKKVKDWILPRAPDGVMRNYRWQALNLRGFLTMKRQGLTPPPPMSVPNGTMRLYIGPANYAGQGSAWAEAVTRLMPDVAAANMAMAAANDYLGYPSSYSIPRPIYLGSRRWNRRHREVLLRFTHVLIEALLPNVRTRFPQDVSREAQWLTSSGVSVGWMCHGTEIRLPSRHKALEPWSPYAQTSSSDLEERALRYLEIIEASGLPVFVSTPDLLIDAPRAKWCPVVIDPDRWKVENASFDRARLRVLHSSTNRAKKGTDLVLPTLLRLEKEGILDLELVEGAPNAEMAVRVSHADVVIDQFRIGSYGVGACEAMAAGRVVVGHVSDQVRQTVHQQTGYELPIVEATPDSLEHVMRGFHDDRQHCLDASAKGPTFAKAVHDGRLSVAALSSLLTNRGGSG